jgi:hypothetical protein
VGLETPRTSAISFTGLVIDNTTEVEIVLRDGTCP